jgi:hypothetical protein
MEGPGCPKYDELWEAQNINIQMDQDQEITINERLFGEK